MRRIFAFLLLAFTASLIAQQMPVPTVEVAPVMEQQAFQSRRYTGQLLSPSSVSLVARVSGEMLSQGFAEGDYVEAGQLLYQLDDVRYDALVKAAEASIAGTEAHLRYSKANYERVKNLYEKNVDTLDSMESALMNYQNDEAQLASARASLITAKDDLKNTKILAPISGKIGLTSYTVGNYLTPSSGVLATIVQLDPIRLSFSVSNRDFLTLFGSEKALRENAVIRIRLADGSLYPQEGTFEFLNNEANRSTDTIALYASFPNADHTLLPGSAVTVLLSQKMSVTNCAVIPSAIMNDASTAFVWVVDEQNVAHRRNVVLGSADANVQLVTSGLSAGEKIITEGTHKVMMDGQTVNPVDRQ